MPHQVIDDVQEHWSIIAAALAVIWALLVWFKRTIFGYYATHDDLHNCHKEVKADIRLFEKENMAAHKKIEEKLNEHHNEVMTLLINHVDKVNRP